MNEPYRALSVRVDEVSPAPIAPASLDWHALADQRLTRLIELEHDHSVMQDRLASLQVDYRQLLVAREERLQHIAGLDRQHMQIERRLAEMARECEQARAAFRQMHADFVTSRSWRLTRPLRAISRWSVIDHGGVRNVVRALLRISLVRRCAGFLVRRMPGLHQRLRGKLYPQPDRTSHEDVL